MINTWGVLKQNESKIIGNYTLRFPILTSTDYTCILGDSENVHLDGGGYDILIATDFNNDGLLDFIIQNARKYTFKRYQVLMSNKFEKKCIVVASNELYGC